MPESFQRVSVVSDLHLPPGPDLGNISASTGRQLVAWTERRRSEGAAESAVVLAGDIVDFLLLESRPDVLDLRDIRRFVRSALQQLETEWPWVRDWRKALAGYACAGGRIVLLPGNHDPEWLHPHAVEELTQWLQSGIAADRFPDERLTVVRNADIWEAQVGSWHTIVVHGHQFDDQNRVDRETIFEAIRAGQDSVALPPGSQLVLGPLRHFKQAVDPDTGARRFPFLEAVKPEIGHVIALLLALDPKLFFRRIPQALALTPKVMLRSVSGRLRDLGGLEAKLPPRQILSPEAGQAGEQESLVDQLAKELIDALPEDDRAAIDATLARLDEYFNLDPEQYAVRGTALSLDSPVRRWFLRWWLKRESTTSQGEKFFSLTHRDDFDNRLIARYLPDEVSHRVVIAGHTHAARCIRLPHERIYLNTGTWTSLLDLSQCGETREDLDRLVDDLSEGRIPSFQRLTWAEVTHAGCWLHTESKPPGAGPSPLPS